MLLGMAATFALVATLAAVGGGWAVTANEYGRKRDVMTKKTKLHLPESIAAMIVALSAPLAAADLQNRAAGRHCLSGEPLRFRRRDSLRQQPGFRGDMAR